MTNREIAVALVLCRARIWVAVLGTGGLIAGILLPLPSCGGKSACDRAVGKLRACDLLTDGSLMCQAEANDDCMAACLEQATCSQVKTFYCENVSGDPVAACVESCETKPMDCGDGSGTYAPRDACDGIDDCANAKDEQGCPTFRCGGGQLVPATSRCDGFDDCDDAKDEDGCPTFTCGDGEVVPEWYRCDGDSDCGDGSDELGCPEEAMLKCE